MVHSESDLNELKRPEVALGVYSARVSLARKGSEFLGLCPFHADKTPSLTIFPRDGFLLWKCFAGCGSGNVIQFLQQVDGIGFSEAIEKIKTLSGWEKGKQKVNATFAKVVPENKTYATYPIAKIAGAEKALAESSAALSWLKSRGISLETAQRFHLGFTQSAEAVTNAHEFLKDGWIICPTISGSEITLVKYRSIKGKAILRKSGMATGLYNLDAVEPFDDVCVVEGEPDTWTMAQAGYAAVGLPSATYTLTEEDRARLLQANNIFLAGDMDTAGQAAMNKLWAELKDRTYKIEWPCKDANETFLTVCQGDVEKFKALVETLKGKARAQSMPHIYDLSHTIRNADDTRPMDNPSRIRFPWPVIDGWDAILPGDLMYLFAGETGMGKSSWLQGILLHNAINFGKVVINYSAELSPEQYARRVVAHLVRKDKKLLDKSDFLTAAGMMGSAQFYNGYKPGANYKEVIELLREAKKHYGADIIALDHIHFLTRGERDENKALAEGMRMLKDLAIEFRVAVIVVGQPRKADQNHRGRVAITSDIKGSEAGGSDASQVFIMHRNRLEGAEDGKPLFEPITTINLDKARESETASTKLFFEGKICTFFPMTGEGAAQ